MLMPTPLILIFCALAGLTSCSVEPHKQAFYASHFNGNSEAYHTLPMHTDTARTAVYARASGFGGQANDLNTDHFGGGSFSIYLAQHGSWWQSFYGIEGTFGCYLWHLYRPLYYGKIYAVCPG